jgi:predicted deacylase
MTTSAIRLGSLTAQPGTRVTGTVPVDVGVATLELPVAIVHGSRPGPRVAVTAGIHGAEYVSIAALREVALGLDRAAGGRRHLPRQLARDERG